MLRDRYEAILSESGTHERRNGNEKGCSSGALSPEMIHESGTQEENNKRRAPEMALLKKIIRSFSKKDLHPFREKRINRVHMRTVVDFMMAA